MEPKNSIFFLDGLDYLACSDSKLIMKLWLLWTEFYLKKYKGPRTSDFMFITVFMKGCHWTLS
jgi:hypothetical protein